MARILIIDDEPDILLVLEQMLLEAGYEVVTSTEPEEAVKLTREHRPDAAILDVMMPEVSGFDVLKALREDPVTRELPVLFLSALVDSGNRVRGLREGADDYMGKPFDFEELILRLERLVGRRGAAAVERKLSRRELERSLTTSGGHLLGQVRLGRYEALEVVGKGAMGLVLRGWDPWLKRPVALKTLRLDKLVDVRDLETKVERLLNEAVMVAHFSHPHIVAVYDVDVEPELAFMAMEYVDGPSLATYLQENGPLAPPDAVHVGLAVARALEAAHENEIVHHDVKPGNVLLGRDGSIKVTDFGIAQLGHSLAQETAKVFGTLGYLAPEALEGKGYSHRSDLFALGAVLYECLAGQRAFGGKSVPERVQNTVLGQIEPLRKVAPRVPSALEKVVLSLLARNPAQRLRTAADTVARLGSLADSKAVWRPRFGPAKKGFGEAASTSQHSSLFSFEDLRKPKR